jgi:hypothetical protein
MIIILYEEWLCSADFFGPVPLRRTAQEVLWSLIRKTAEKRLRLVNQTR